MIKMLLKKPLPEKIRFFQKNGFIVPKDWRELYQEAETISHEAAEFFKLGVIDKTEEALKEAVKNGATAEHFVKNLKKTFQKMGIWNTLVRRLDGNDFIPVSHWRLRLIHWAHTQKALQSARMKRQLSTIGTRPYGEYICLMTKNSRESHMALHKQIRPLEEWIDAGLYPPNGWNCHCRIRTLSKRDLERRGLMLETAAIPIKADKGWQTNPADNFTPDLSGYNPEFVKQYQKALNEWKQSR